MKNFQYINIMFVNHHYILDDIMFYTFIMFEATYSKNKYMVYENILFYQMNKPK